MTTEHLPPPVPEEPDRWFTGPEHGIRLEAYLSRQLLNGYWVAAAAVGSLLWLLEILQRLERLGDGSETLFGAVWHALLMVPEQLVELLPVMTILATASILGILQGNREIIVLRMVGWSPWRIAGVALIPMVLVTLTAMLYTQWGSPLLYHGSGPLFGGAIGDDGIWHNVHGLWLWNGSELLNIRELRFGHIPADINIFRFGEDGRLFEHLHADLASVEAGRPWRLEGVTIWTLEPGNDRFSVHPEVAWQSFLTGSQLEMFQRAPGTLSVTDLILYVIEMRRAEQPASSYELVLWERMALPVACLGMVLVAVAMAGSPDTDRSGGIGRKMSSAVGVGLLYLMLAQLVTYAGLRAGLPPPVIALTAPALLVLAGWLLMGRAK